MAEVQIKSGAIDPAGCISEGWELIKPDYGLFLLMGVMFIIILVVSNFIPYVGSLLSTILSAPLLCGFYIALLLKRRGEIVSFGNLFDGFKHFLPSFLVMLIPSIPSLIFGMVVGFSSAFITPDTAGANSSIFRGYSAFLIVSGIIVYLCVTFLYILLFFALPLIADRNFGVVDAIKLSIKGTTQNLGGVILLYILQILLGFAGVIALCIGIIFVLPVLYASNIIAYKQVFPDENDNSFFNEPPSPATYREAFGG